MLFIPLTASNQICQIFAHEKVPKGRNLRMADASGTQLSL